MASTRQQVVKILQSYVGVKQGSAKHKELVDTFNKVKPHGEVANYDCAWCAITATAVQIMAGNSQKVVPYSYNCGTLIQYAKELGIWVEDDSYKAQMGDLLIYSWKDTTGSKADCKYGADHVGTIESIKDGWYTVIEGNMGTTKAVGRRKLAVNGQYIRGFITPKYAPTKAEKLANTAESLAWKKGTNKEKWAYSTGAPTAKCKNAMKARGYDTKIEYSDCGKCINTVIYHALGRKSVILPAPDVPFNPVKGFKIVYSGKSIKKSQLKRGDIIRYKKDDSHQHTMIYLGNGLIAEGGKGIRFFVIRKTDKYLGKWKNIQILRAIEV